MTSTTPASCSAAGTRRPARRTSSRCSARRRPPSYPPDPGRGRRARSRHDWIARVNAPPSQQVYVNRGGALPREPPTVGTHDVGPGLVHDERRLEGHGRPGRCTSSPGSTRWPTGWTAPEGSVVFTGDTQPCQTRDRPGPGADVMLCMCWDDQEVMNAERRERRAVRHHGRRRDGPGGRRQEAGPLAHGAAPIVARPAGEGHRRRPPHLLRRDPVRRGADVVRALTPLGSETGLTANRSSAAESRTRPGQPSCVAYDSAKWPRFADQRAPRHKSAIVPRRRPL